jgi:hypothetical protein
MSSSLHDNERFAAMQKFSTSWQIDSDVLALIGFLEEARIPLPLILCDSEERINNPIPSQETKVTSYKDAAKNYVIYNRFFHDDKKSPVILDASRHKVYPR